VSRSKICFGSWEKAHIEAFSYRSSQSIKIFFGGWGQGGEMNPALYAHMNNKRKNKIKCFRKKNLKKFFYEHFKFS
jgi:hypothetical protein